MRDERYAVMVELPDNRGYIAEDYSARSKKEALEAARRTGLTSFAESRKRINVVKF